MRRAVVVVLLCLFPVTAGCGGAGGPGGAGGSERTLHVYAAASLTQSFTTLGEQFERDHPGTRVVFNFGPSSGLAEQIRSGAPADVFASASATNMATLVDSGDAANPQDFARNSMEIAVPSDNPGDVTGVEDLARPGVKVAVCQDQVPCGRVAAEVIARAKLSVRPVTEEVDVKSVLTKVVLGEVDAGLVYVTDVQAASDDVVGIEIPADLNATTDYPIAALTGSEHASTARQFLDLVLSDDGARVLRGAGFQRP